MYGYTVTVYYTCAVDSRTDPKSGTVFFSFRFHANTHHCNCLPFIQRILNSSIHSSTNASPASLMFGNQINFDSGILSPFPHLPEIEISASKVICETNKIQDTLMAQAQTASRTMDEAHIATSPQEITMSAYDCHKFMLQPYITLS